MGKDNGVKGRLKEALYGDAVGASFNEDGVLAGGCGLGMVSRSQYCSHIEGVHPPFFGGSNRNGCFGHSLIGTFLCLCVPGNDRKDLCGLNNVHGGAGWTSSNGEEQTLFQRVWTGIEQKCKEHNTTGHVGDLESAVNNIKEETKRNKISGGNNGYYLGSGTAGATCSNTSPQHGCVTYAPTGNGDTPHIPWADKILEAINISKTHQKASSIKSPQTDHHHEDQDDSSDEASEGETDDHEEEGEEDESTQNHDHQNPATPPRSKRKRRSIQKNTEQPAESLKAILHHDDGSFLPQPFWLLSAVVI
ncbi:unnamed protein product [Trypanosoma congolense IL3000]|uniref:WGS project CAEQ00000000 data, annotated contig 1053 n=1 Tax=Trypanosoma congolense (strain IL3000) TaxID=1068625 RepID=F9W3H3_TRYCI|nr:unnamed protein product [Trypanosoma congolense IL3000]